jgi:hypothetical protein
LRGRRRRIFRQMGETGKHGIGPAQVCLIILFDFDCQWSFVTFCLNYTPPSSIWGLI